uniref:glyceraldehyde-3-phosphate dehydrogenase (phosphorylating) n=1 Tax=Chlorocebus sabaeus TaxID=60711 RepID=A0A0D9RA04_CHLSB
MVEVQVRLNGFGHIECLVTKAAFNFGKVIVINDPFIDLNYVLCIFQYFHGIVKAENGKLVISGNLITMFLEEDPTKSKCGDASAHYIVEPTSILLPLPWRRLGRTESGESKVIISALSVDDPMFMMGVNHEKFKNSLKIISNASCTTNFFAPLAKVIHANFGIMEGLMTTVHAITITYKTNGPSGKQWCDSHGTLQNIICASTGAASTKLNRKLTGMSFCVPTTNVSIMDLTFYLEKPAKYDDIQKVVMQALEGPFKGILGYTEHQGLFSIFNSDTYSSTFHAGSALHPRTTLSRYDNEFGYSNRVVGLKGVRHPDCQP